MGRYAIIRRLIRRRSLCHIQLYKYSVYSLLREYDSFKWYVATGKLLGYKQLALTDDGGCMVQWSFLSAVFKMEFNRF